ncbi:MAG: hypothetical protein RLZZ223_292 [Candidatus Parcubacteria bacterium]|jgi:cell division septal protein FtsQ
MKKSYIPKTYGRYKSKPAKSKPNRLLLFLQIIVILALMAGIVYLAYSPVLDLVEINVRVEDENLKREIKSKSEDLINSQNYWWYNNKNIFLLRADKLEQYLLKEFPQIKSIIIKRSLNRELDLEISFRTILLTMCENENCYNISEDGLNIGLRLEPDPIARLSGLTLKAKGDSIMSPREAQWIKTILQEYSKIEEIKISEIAVQQKSGDFIVRVFVYTEQGYYIMLDLDTDVLYQVEVLKQVFKSQLNPDQRSRLEYIDLRIKDRVYYKFK